MMPTKQKKRTPDDPEQSKRFIKTAREVEVDESPEAFDRAFRQIVTPKQRPAGSETDATTRRDRSR
jgi:hypothetical protein